MKSYLNYCHSSKGLLPSRVVSDREKMKREKRKEESLSITPEERGIKSNVDCGYSTNKQ